MPEGPFGLPRLSTFGPLSRETEKEIKERWSECPDSGKAKDICESIKYHSIRIIKDQDAFPECQTLIEINEGQCYNIAESVLDDVDGVKVYKMGDYDHVWIVHNGRHYDAEIPSGVDRKDDIPILKRLPKHKMLEWAKMGAKAEGREIPKTFEDTIVDVTDEYR